VSFSDLSRDPRVNRQIEWLSLDYEVTVCGYGTPDHKGVHTISIPQRKRHSLVKYVKAAFALSRFYYITRGGWIDHRKVLKECMATPYDAVLVNDTIALPYDVKLAQHRKVPLIFYAYEYSPGEFVDNLL